MSFARAVTLPKGLGQTVCRRVGTSSRAKSFKQLGRRGYASGHGQQQSSELPWIIGSVAVTVPAAGWLLQQAPKKSDHHGHDSHHEEHAEPEVEEKEAEESSEEEAEKKEDTADEPKEESTDAEEEKDEGGEKSEDTEEGGEDAEKPDSSAPQQINYESSMDKGPGEGQKGERSPSEKKGEKDAQGDQSGAKHPYLDDPEKSKKGLGVTETAKIHGTVDPKTGARGVGSTGEGSS